MVSTRASRATKPSATTEKAVSQPPKRVRTKKATATEDASQPEATDAPKATKPVTRTRRGAASTEPTDELSMPAPTKATRGRPKKTEEKANKEETKRAPLAKKQPTRAKPDKKVEVAPVTTQAARKSSRSTRQATVDVSEDAPLEKAEDAQRAEAEDEDDELRPAVAVPAKRTRRAAASVAEKKPAEVPKRTTRAADRTKLEKPAPATRKRTRAASEELDEKPVPAAKRATRTTIAAKGKAKAKPSKRCAEDQPAPKDALPEVVENIEERRLAAVTETASEQPYTEDAPIRQEDIEDPFLSRPTKQIKLDLAPQRLQTSSPKAVPPFENLDKEKTKTPSKLPCPTPSKNVQPVLQSKTPAPQTSLLQGTPWKLPATVAAKNSTFVGPIPDVSAPFSFNALPKKLFGTGSSVLSASPRKEAISASVLKMPPMSPWKRGNDGEVHSSSSHLTSAVAASPKKFPANVSLLKSSSKGGFTSPAKASLLAGTPRKVKTDSVPSSLAFDPEIVIPKPFGSSMINATPMRFRTSTRTARETAPSPMKNWLDGTPFRSPAMSFAASPSVNKGDADDETMRLDEPTFNCIMKSPVREEQEIAAVPEASPAKLRFAESISEALTIEPAAIESDAVESIETDDNEMPAETEVPATAIAVEAQISAAEAEAPNDKGKEPEDDLAMSEFIFTTPRRTSRMITDFTDFNKRASSLGTAEPQHPNEMNEESVDDISPAKDDIHRQADALDETLHFPRTPTTSNTPTAIPSREERKEVVDDGFDETLCFPRTPEAPLKTPTKPASVKSAYKSVHRPGLAQKTERLENTATQAPDKSLGSPQTPTTVRAPRIKPESVHTVRSLRLEPVRPHAGSEETSIIQATQVRVELSTSSTMTRQVKKWAEADVLDETLNFPRTPDMARTAQIKLASAATVRTHRSEQQKFSNVEDEETLNFPQTPTEAYSVSGKINSLATVDLPENVEDNSPHYPQIQTARDTATDEAVTTVKAVSSPPMESDVLNETLNLPATPIAAFNPSKCSTTDTARTPSKENDIFDETLHFPDIPTASHTSPKAESIVKTAIASPSLQPSKPEVGFDETLHFPATPTITDKLQLRPTAAQTPSTPGTEQDDTEYTFDETLQFPNTPIIPTPQRERKAPATPTPARPRSESKAISTARGLPFSFQSAAKLAAPSANLAAFPRPILSPTKSSLRTPGPRPDSPKKTVSFDGLSPANQPTNAAGQMSPAKQNKILRGLVFFVDVRNSAGQDAGDIFVSLLQDMGALCLKFWPDNAFPEVTHVLFKDGEQSTLRKVRSSGGKVKCVNIGWPLDCEKSNARVDEAKYQIDLSQVLVRTPMKSPLGDKSPNTTPTRPIARTPGTIKSAFKAAKTPFSAYKTAMLKTPQFKLALEGKENSMSAGEKSSEEGSPSTPSFLHPERLVQMTCPPKQTQRTLFESEKADIKRRLEFNKRRSLGFALGVESPAKRLRFD